MKNKLIKTGVLAALTTCFALTSCQKEEMKSLTTDPARQSASGVESVEMNAKGMAEIRLADTWTAGMVSINLDIQRVAVHYANSINEFGGWLYFPTKQQDVDILQYQDGKDALLATNLHMPTGLIDQARIELGDNNTVVWIDKDGKHFRKLTLTEAEHIAMAPVNLRIDQHTKLGLVLDINAVQSIILIGGGETVRFHPHMKLGRFTHASINGAPGEHIGDGTK